MWQGAEQVFLKWYKKSAGALRLLGFGASGLQEAGSGQHQLFPEPDQEKHKRQADILIGQGKKIPEVCKEIDVSENTYYRWRQKYGGMSPDMIKQFRALQKVNTRLRSVIADQALDIVIFKEATKLGN